MSIETMSLAEIHEKTSHVRDKIPPHAMDFGHYPLPCKAYDRGISLSLGEVDAPGQHLTGDALFPYLSDFLYLSYGVTQIRQAGAIPLLYRTAPSAGGLYPCHLYVGVLPRDRGDKGDKEDKDDKDDKGHRDTAETSMFYYEPTEHRLILLRHSGDDVPDLSLARKSQTSLVFMVTACLYNGAWKYRDRAIRYVMLDGGHLAENLLLAGGNQEGCLAYDFDDQEMGRLLGLDLSWEVPLAVATMGGDRSVPESIRELAQLTPCFPDVRIRPGEIRYMEKFPFPARVHALGYPVRQSTGEAKTSAVGQPLSGADHLPDLMAQRRSRRNFIGQTVEAQTQKDLLYWLGCGGLEFGGLECDGNGCDGNGCDGKNGVPYPWISLAVACRNWEGLADGIYTVDQESGCLSPMVPGNVQGALSRICLGQEWVGLAGAVFLCLADFKALEQAGGIRAYRYAMLDAGRAGQRLYLGAEATGLGCCGIGAIYDDEAASLLDLQKDTALIYALAVGPVKKKIR